MVQIRNVHRNKGTRKTAETQRGRWANVRIEEKAFRGGQKKMWEENAQQI